MFSSLWSLADNLAEGLTKKKNVKMEMEQKRLVSNGEEGTFTFDEEFKQNNVKESDKGYMLKVSVYCPGGLHELHSYMPFLSKRMEIGKCQKLVRNVYDNKNFIIHIRTLKQALDSTNTRKSWKVSWGQSSSMFETAHR